MKAYFYVNSPAASRTLEDGQVEKVFPFVCPRLALVVWL